MNLALCVNHISDSLSDNLNSIKNYIHEASSAGAECIVFSEAALTGLINNDDPVHDQALSISSDDSVIEDLYKCCRENKIDMVFGFFEKCGNSLFDAVVYFEHQNRISHIYRRITSGWHGAGEESEIYRQGTEVKVFDTNIGRISFLICGDLFDDKLVEAVRDNDSEIVIVPFARCFPDDIEPESEWNSKEKYFYTEQIKKIGKETVLVNYISGYGSGDYFGGAMFVSKVGNINAEMPAFEKGIMYVDLH